MFETLMEMLTALEACGDVYFDVDDTDGSVSVTFEDFDGFDDDWSEIDREYEMPEVVDAVFALLEGCPSEGDYYVTYLVDGRSVEVGFSSYDI